MYYMNKDYDNTFKYYQKALEIGLKVLPVNHIELNQVYVNIDQFYYEKFNSNSDEQQHSSLIYNTIGDIFDEMNNYEKALIYYDIAYQLESKILSPNILYIKKYNNNIKRINNNLSNFTFKNFLQILSTIYEYLFNSG